MSIFSSNKICVYYLHLECKAMQYFYKDFSVTSVTRKKNRAPKCRCSVYIPLRIEDLPSQRNSSLLNDESDVFQTNELSTLPLTPKIIILTAESDPVFRQIYYYLTSVSSVSFRSK